MRIVYGILLLCAIVYSRELTMLKTDGDRIVSSSGELVNFKGIHITTEAWGDWKWPISDSLYALGNEDPFFPQKEIPRYMLDDDDFQNIKMLNPSLVRYELSYNIFALDNPFRDNNMVKLKSDVQRFNDMGIYVVPVLHYGPGLNLSAAGYVDKKDGALRTKSIFEDGNTFNQHAEWWEFVAGEFVGNPGVAAYQIYVEPRVPAESEGGWEIVKARTLELCERIRAVDPEHILVTHHAHSREANPGEKYFDPTTGEATIDSGEQGIIWSSDPSFYRNSVLPFPLIDLPNMIYSFSIYTPYRFCSEGAQVDYGGEAFTDHYFRSELTRYISPRIEFGKEHGVPILVDEYGANHQQERGDILRWLKAVHEVLDLHEIPSWFYQYKGEVDPYNGAVYNYGLYSYIRFDEDIIRRTSSGYSFTGPAARTAQESGFSTLFENYYWNSGDVRTLSMTNNQDVYHYMKEYLSTPSVITTSSPQR